MKFLRRRPNKLNFFVTSRCKNMPFAELLTVHWCNRIKCNSFTHNVNNAINRSAIHSTRLGISLRSAEWLSRQYPCSIGIIVHFIYDQIIIAIYWLEAKFYVWFHLHFDSLCSVNTNRSSSPQFIIFLWFITAPNIGFRPEHSSLAPVAVYYSLADFS